ncbi:MAG: dTDP-4-dehydrorhamnose reductase [Oxalobacteraceae bacterium]
MKILVTGRDGQVGGELAKALAGLGEIVVLGRTHMDLADPDAVRKAIRAERPSLIVNAAAYTAVDLAESAQELAYAINAQAPGIMAEEAKILGAALVHYSTDYVYNGGKQAPWLETDMTGPLSVYGKSKLAGEQAIAAVGVPYLIFRTSWVYGLTGKNFLLTMLRLAQSKPELSIVSDQIGAPTWSRTIATATAAALKKAGDPDRLSELSGVYHLCAGGQTSWYGFAEKIFSHPFVVQKPALKPIPTQDYPTPAQRPKNSVMSTEKFQKNFDVLPAWDAALATCLSCLPAEAPHLLQTS